MMKKLLSLLLCLAMLTSCALADWDDIVPIGNDRVGYLHPDSLWLTMRASNMSDEAIDELEESSGFAQYVSLDLGMVVLTMASYGEIEDVGDYEAAVHMLLLQRLVDYLKGRVPEQENDVELREDVVPNTLTSVLMGQDLDGYGEPRPVMFVVFMADGSLYQCEFESVWDDETREVLLDMMRTWTPTLPEEE